MATYFYYLTIYYLVIIVNCHELYESYSIEDDELCSPIQKRKIRLGRGHESGLLVKQSRLNNHPRPWTYNLNCNFTVDATEYKDGIFAVIQSLSFRRNEVTGECIDYLQFTGTKEPTRRYCGTLGVNLLPLETFIEPKGRLHVQISIARDALQPGEKAELRLVFTAYTDCYRAEERSMPCIPEQAAGCIWGRYWNDLIPNCPSQDCIDEGGCESLSHILDPHPPDAAPVTLGAITTILLCLLLFLTCFWACKKHQICCWGPHCNEETTPQTNREIMQTPTIQPVIELHEPLPSSVNPSPSAPDLDKDKPPAYETLFPER